MHFGAAVHTVDWKESSSLSWLPICHLYPLVSPPLSALPLSSPSALSLHFSSFSFLQTSTGFLHPRCALTSFCVSFLLCLLITPHLLERRRGQHQVLVGGLAELGGWHPSTGWPRPHGRLPSKSGLWREQLRPASVTCLGLFVPNHSVQMGQR